MDNIFEKAIFEAVNAKKEVESIKEEKNNASSQTIKPLMENQILALLGVKINENKEEEEISIDDENDIDVELGGEGEDMFGGEGDEEEEYEYQDDEYEEEEGEEVVDMSNADLDELLSYIEDLPEGTFKIVKAPKYSVQKEKNNFMTERNKNKKVNEDKDKWQSELQEMLDEIAEMEEGKGKSKAKDDEEDVMLEVIMDEEPKDMKMDLSRVKNHGRRPFKSESPCSENARRLKAYQKKLAEAKNAYMRVTSEMKNLQEGLKKSVNLLKEAKMKADQANLQNNTLYRTVQLFAEHDMSKQQKLATLKLMQGSKSVDEAGKAYKKAKLVLEGVKPNNSNNKKTEAEKLSSIKKEIVTESKVKATKKSEESEGKKFVNEEVEKFANKLKSVINAKV